MATNFESADFDGRLQVHDSAVDDTSGGGGDRRAVLNTFFHSLRKRIDIEAVKQFIITNFIPLGFAFVVTIALPYPYPGIVVSSLRAGNYRIVEFLNVCLVFLISGVTLKVEDLWAVLKFPAAIIYGVVGINFVTTLLAFVMLELPFHPKEFSVGLAIFCVVPTTLGVGVALTQAAKGNQLMSLLLTVSSNMIGIASVPFLLQVYLSDAAVVKINPLKLLMNLVLSGQLLNKRMQYSTAITSRDYQHYRQTSDDGSNY